MTNIWQPLSTAIFQKAWNQGVEYSHLSYLTYDVLSQQLLWCFFCWFFKIDFRSRHVQKSTSFMYVCIYIDICSLACQWSQRVTWCGQHCHERLGLGYWSRGTRWWAGGLGGEEHGDIQWYKTHAFFQLMLRISAGNQKGAKLGCDGRLQSSGCYWYDAAVEIRGWFFDTAFPGQMEKCL